MSANADKPWLWKADVARSIDWYNDWFARAAPRAYQEARLEAAGRVEQALSATANLTAITAEALRGDPRILSLLRLTATMPLSRDRLAGLAQAPLSLIAAMERDGQVPPQLVDSVVDADLTRLGSVIARLADRDIFPWLEHASPLSGTQVHRAAMIVADRLCAASADAIIRAAHHTRQVEAIARWLERHGYGPAEAGRRLGIDHLRPGTFALSLDVPVLTAGRAGRALFSADVALMPAGSDARDLPVLVVARAAGDGARAAKMRAEDAARLAMLRGSYGDGVRLVLLLCGYFDSGYLGYIAAEGIDWIWEHRIDDLAALGAAPAASERPGQQPAAAASNRLFPAHDTQAGASKAPDTDGSPVGAPASGTRF